ncbi:MAG: EamA family transporter [Gammaproteobacteria bacterium]|nr:EamA family transporter [Gammaproteobacteria bacterium]
MAPMRLTDLLQVLTVVLIWGLNFAAVKLTVAALPPFALTALRFGGVALLLSPYLRFGRGDLRALLQLALVLGVGHFGLLFLGLKGADAATTALLIQLGVPFSSILAAIFFADRLGWRRGVGMAFAFAGGALLAGEPGGGTPLAMTALLVSAFCWAGSNIIIKRISHIPPLSIIAWMSLLSVMPITLLSLLLEEGQWQAVTTAEAHVWGLFAYTLIGSSIVAYALWFRLLGRLSLNQVVPYTLLAPMLGVASGVLLLDEAFTLYKAVGGAMTLAGVAFIQWRQLRLRGA